MCLDMGIIDKLIQILIVDDNEIKKEAVWAVSNCTASASFAQFNSLVERGIIKALLSTLKMSEARVLAVSLEGIDNILKSGQENFKKHGVENRFSVVLENEGGLDLLEGLQMHSNHQSYQRAVKILESYFQEEDGGLDLSSVPTQPTGQNQFNF